MATTKRNTKAQKHEAHVVAYVEHELASIGSAAAIQVLEAVSLEQALAESGETLADLKEVPSAETPAVRTGRVDKSGVMYVVTDKASASVRSVDTLQRGCTIAVGAQWRNNEFRAPNTRLAAVAALMDAADEEEQTISHAAAMAALKPLKDQALLGSGTPASYIREFVRIGYLEQV
jgi:hypothetical protein